MYVVCTIKNYLSHEFSLSILYLFVCPQNSPGKGSFDADLYGIIPDMPKTPNFHVIAQTCPSPRELHVACLLSQYFHCDVTIVRPQSNVKSADLLIGDEHWEIKSPLGNSANTIQNILKKAEKAILQCGC